jgi:hypothetical protein
MLRLRLEDLIGCEPHLGPTESSQCFVTTLAVPLRRVFVDTSAPLSLQSTLQLGSGSSKLTLPHNHLSPLFTPDHVQDYAIIDDRKNADDFIDPASRSSHADKLTNREEWLHHVFQSKTGAAGPGLTIAGLDCCSVVCAVIRSCETVRVSAGSIGRALECGTPAHGGLQLMQDVPHRALRLWAGVHVEPSSGGVPSSMTDARGWRRVCKVRTRSCRGSSDMSGALWRFPCRLSVVSFFPSGTLVFDPP